MTVIDSRGFGWTELKSPVFDETGQNYYLILPSPEDNQHGSYHHIGKFSVNVSISINWEKMTIRKLTNLKYLMNLCDL